MSGFCLALHGFAPILKALLIDRRLYAHIEGDETDNQKLNFKQFRPTNQKGFTLIEIMSVLIIMGVMVSISLTKWGMIADSASVTALKVGVRELNTREFLEWSKIKVSDAGYKTDLEVYNAVDKDLGSKYRWQPTPTIANGTLHYDAAWVDLNRTASDIKSYGYWQ